MRRLPTSRRVPTYRHRHPTSAMRRCAQSRDLTRGGRPLSGDSARHGSCLRNGSMLRITVTTRADRTTVALEGRLAGPWVDELRACWRNLAAPPDARPIRVDLDAVTFIDTAGKALLWAMHEQGAVLVASGCMTRAILEEISRKSPERGHPYGAGKGDD